MNKLKVINEEAEFLKLLPRINSTATSAIPIYSSNKHYALNTLSLLIVYFDNETVVLPFEHKEGRSLSYNLISKLEPFCMKVPRKKDLMYFLSKGTLIDLCSRELRETGALLDHESFYSEIIRSTRIKFSDIENINDFIPVMKWVEYADSYIKYLMNIKCLDTYESFESMIIPTLHFIENSGMSIDRNEFESHHSITSNNFDGKLIYTSYNPYTLTGRPSNSYSNYNFAAINKKDRSRKAFNSRFGDDAGRLILIDFESFHLRLISNLIRYNQPQEPFHEHLGKLYFNKSEISKDEYEQGKQLTFSLLYSDSHSEIEFFQKIQQWVGNFWADLQRTGYIISPLGHKIYINHISNNSKSKSFNYLVQMLETETALFRISQLIPIFKGIESKMILYTYDSLLIDFKMDEIVDILPKVVQSLSYEGTYLPVRIYYGLNYNDLVDVSSQFLMTMC